MKPRFYLAAAAVGLTITLGIHLVSGDVQLTPTTYLVNKRGEIVKRYLGEPDFAELHRLIERLLAEA